MMNNRKAWLLYLLTALLVAWMAYRSGSGRGGSVTLPKSIRSFDASLLEQWTRPFPVDTNFTKALTRVWGIMPSTPKKPKKKKVSKKKLGKEEPKFLQKGRSICKGKKCSRLLGIFSKDDRRYASFYVPNQRHPIVTVEENGTLPGMPTLYLQEAKEGRVTVAERNGTKRWSFGFFQVDAEKYRPKEVNASAWE
jgi:hypothetical protein